MSRLLAVLACAACVEPAPGEPRVTIDDALAVGELSFETTLGTFHVQLDAQNAPLTVENLLDYVDAGHYDGDDGQGATVFHRVIPGFVVQGGGLTEAPRLKPVRRGVHNESDNGLQNLRGTVAMARTSAPDSATAGFFVNLVNNPSLDASPGARDGYAVFGEVTVGLAVLDQIAAVSTTTQDGLDDVPVEPIAVIEVRRGDRP